MNGLCKLMKNVPKHFPRAASTAAAEEAIIWISDRDSCAHRKARKRWKTSTAAGRYVQNHRRTPALQSAKHNRARHGRLVLYWGGNRHRTALPVACGIEDVCPRRDVSAVLQECYGEFRLKSDTYASFSSAVDFPLRNGLCLQRHLERKFVRCLIKCAEFLMHTERGPSDCIGTPDPSNCFQYVEEKLHGAYVCGILTP